MMTKPVSPWGKDEKCPLEGFDFFKERLSQASFHHAGPSDEWSNAKKCIQQAAGMAIEQRWPYWAIERMFRECAPLVAWDQFMQLYINELFSRVKEDA